MKRLAYLAVIIAGAVLLPGNASAADFGDLVTGLHKVQGTALQTKYSNQLHQSVNAAVLRNIEQNCSRGGGVQTYTLAGVMRLDGILQSPQVLPDNAATRCIADKMSGVTFPLPPGNQRGWPVAMQIDAATGKVIYTAGEDQPALPRYSSSAPTPWVYTPVPQIPAGKGKICTVSVWLSVDVEGRVSQVDLDESNCTPVLKKAAMEAAGQWIYLGKPGVKREDSMDVRLTFKFGRTRVRVSL